MSIRITHIDGDPYQMPIGSLEAEYERRNGPQKLCASSGEFHSGSLFIPVTAKVKPGESIIVDGEWQRVDMTPGPTTGELFTKMDRRADGRME